MDMTPTPVQIVDVLEARYTEDGRIDCLVKVEGTQRAVVNAVGTENLETNGVLWRGQCWYTWNADEEYDNSWNLWLWFYEHPDFEVAPYVAPEPEPETE
jgi:hypothetical protein